MKVHVVIPARLASTRLPDKPLVDIAGEPMILRVAHQASQARAHSVVIAVDAAVVLDVVRQAGYEAVMTATTHVSGSDRVMEVVDRYRWSDTDLVINVQGDEPLLPPAIIDQLSDFMRENSAIRIATLSEPIERVEDFLDPNVVKVVSDAQGQALYFSRAPIPYPRDELSVGQLDQAQLARIKPQRHVGVYAYRVAALRQFVGLSDASFEHIERLEQLRWLEQGGRISVLPSVEPIPGGVDTAEDLERVRALFDVADATV